jgi:hypothetical protein
VLCILANSDQAAASSFVGDAGEHHDNLPGIFASSNDDKVLQGGREPAAHALVHFSQSIAGFDIRLSRLIEETDSHTEAG